LNWDHHQALDKGRTNGDAEDEEEEEEEV